MVNIHALEELVDIWGGIGKRALNSARIVAHGALARAAHLLQAVVVGEAASDRWRAVSRNAGAVSDRQEAHVVQICLMVEKVYSDMEILVDLLIIIRESVDSVFPVLDIVLMLVEIRVNLILHLLRSIKEVVRLVDDVVEVVRDAVDLFVDFVPD